MHSFNKSVSKIDPSLTHRLSLSLGEPRQAEAGESSFKINHCTSERIAVSLRVGYKSSGGTSH